MQRHYALDIDHTSRSTPNFPDRSSKSTNVDILKDDIDPDVQYCFTVIYLCFCVNNKTTETGADDETKGKQRREHEGEDCGPSGDESGLTR